MADPGARKAAMQDIYGFPGELAAEFAAWYGAAVRWQPAANKWSMLQVAAHLADLEDVFGERLRRIAQEEQPELAAVDPDARAAEQGYQAWDVAQTLAAFRRRRQQNGAFLRGLEPAAWERRGLFTGSGETRSIEQLALRMAEHDARHLRQIREVKRDWAESRLSGPEREILPADVRVDLIESLTRFPRLVEAELVEDRRDAFRWKPAPDAWSIAEVVGHLLDADRLFYSRALAATAEADGAPLAPFDQVKAVAEGGYQQKDVREVAWRFRGEREALMRFVSGRRVQVWSHVGFVGGNRTQPRPFQQLLLRMAVHDANHLFQIRKVRRLRAGAREREAAPAGRA